LSISFWESRCDISLLLIRYLYKFICAMQLIWLFWHVFIPKRFLFWEKGIIHRDTISLFHLWNSVHFSKFFALRFSVLICSKLALILSQLLPQITWLLSKTKMDYHSDRGFLFSQMRYELYCFFGATLHLEKYNIKNGDNFDPYISTDASWRK